MVVATPTPAFPRGASLAGEPGVNPGYFTRALHFRKARIASRRITGNQHV
jgi:hypothetical protein